MKTNHVIEENLSFIVAANITGLGYKVRFSENMTDHCGRPLDCPGYNEITVIGPNNDLSKFWRVWEALYRPEKINFYKRCLPKMLQFVVHPWQEYYRKGIVNILESSK